MGDTVTAVIGFLIGVGVLGAVLVYLLCMPEEAERVAGWVIGLVAMCVYSVDRAAVAYKVQGAVNTMRADLQRDAPDLLEKKLKVKWANVDEAEAQLKGGEILVVMQCSRHTDENIAHAVMAYLPRALLPRARPYLDKARMRAADLVVAKSLFDTDEGHAGAREVFFEKHLDPARAESVALKRKIGELDSLDLEGWLTRILLAEYQILGRQLHPGEPDQACVQESEQLARWLYLLSTRRPGDDSASLAYPGRYFRVAVILVARKDLIERRGLAPYRRRAKRYLYEDKMDAVYLIGRDEMIEAIRFLGEELEADARVVQVSRYEYRLRNDYRKRKLPRDQAILICLRRRSLDRVSELEFTGDDEDDLPEETYDPA